MSTLTSTRPPLSSVLKEATSGAHQTAESSPFMKALLGGRSTLDAYVALLDQLVVVYQALEAAEDQATAEPSVAPLIDARLRRSARIVADIAALRAAGHGGDEPEVLPETLVYAQRIAASTGTWAGAVLGHHYTRYLGDLSGGQIIAHLLGRHHGLDEASLSMYRFEDLSPVPYKRAYRQHLDAAPWTEEQRALLVDEAIASFALSSEITDALWDRS